MLSRIAAVAFLFLNAVVLRAAPVENVSEIPFDFVDGFILIKAVLGANKQPVSMLLDSGAGASVLSLDCAHRLRMTLGAPETVRGVGMQTNAYRLDRVAASAGDVLLDQVPLAVDLRNATELCSRPIDGLIGVDFFRRQPLEIDFAARRIRLQNGVSAPKTDSCRLALKPFNGTLCIPVSVNGSKTRWVRFDTGCNDSLHWVVPRTPAAKSGTNLSIGFMTDTSNMALADLRLGNQLLSKVETSLHAEPLFAGEAGLVGTGVWSRYVVRVDYANREITLR